MDAMLYLIMRGCELYPWIVDAACDAVVFMSLVGIVTVAGRRSWPTTPRPSLAPVERGTHPEPETRPQGMLESEPLADSSPRRPAVERALRAMERWQTTYRQPSRGAEELSRLAGRRSEARSTVGPGRS